MKVKIARLLKNVGEHISLDCSCDLSDVQLWGERPFLKPVKVSGSIRNRAEMIELSLDISAPVSTVCARCLKPLEKTLDVHVDFDVVTELQNPDDDHLLLVEGDELDVDETVRTAVLLNMPMRFLCKEDCKGLCPKCGADLNEGECGCDRRETDPRLAILKTLL